MTGIFTGPGAAPPAWFWPTVATLLLAAGFVWTWNLRPRWAVLALRGLAWLVTALVVGFVLAEGAVRVAGMLSPEVRCGDKNGGLTVGSYHENPRGYFARDPGETCFHAYFDPEVAGCRADLDPARPQVLFLGDSFTQGQGVWTKDTFPSLLDFPGAQRRNCGQGGFSLADSVRTFDQARASYRPALTVYALVLNDLPGPTELANDYINFRTDRLEDFVARNARELLGPLEFLSGSRYVQLLLRARIQREVGDRTEAGYRSAFAPGESLDHGFDEIARIAAASDRFLLVVFPLFVRLDAYPFEEVHATIRREAQRRGIEWLDLLDVFRGLEADDLVVFRTDLHPNEVAHRMAADAIRARLTSLGWMSL